MAQESAVAELDISYIDLDGQDIRVGIRPGSSDLMPLLLFNGVGSPLELMQPFMDQLEAVEIICFDIPGVGGSPTPLLPYRFNSLARLTARLLDKLNYRQVNILGFSWGGALAQAFARNYSHRCHKIVLAATTMGAVALPGAMSELIKFFRPRQLFSGVVRAAIIRNYPRHGCQARPPSQGLLGYCYQLLAGYGWTSFFWLSQIKQPVLLLYSEEDRIVPASNARMMAWRLADVSQACCSGGHFFMLVEPQQSAEAVARFLYSTQ